MTSISALRHYATLLAASVVIAACGNRDHVVAPARGSAMLVGTVRSATSAHLTWTIDPRLDASGGTRVYRNGSVVGRATSAEFIDDALRPENDYAYRVFPIDAQGVEHSASNLVVLRTPLAIVPKLYVSPSTASIVITDSVHFTATVRDSTTGAALAGYPITWSVVAPSVATVTTTGTSHGRGSGSTEIVATSGALIGKATLSVAGPAAPDSVGATLSVVPGAIALHPSESSQLQAIMRTASDMVITGRPVMWTSSNEEIAFVSSTGRIIAMALGSAVITARSGELTAMATVSVEAVPPPEQSPVGSVVVNPSNATKEIGTTVQFTATVKDSLNRIVTDRTITWTSANTAVAQVSAAGIVTGLTAGTTTITATSEGISGQASMVVTLPPPLPVPVATIAITPATAVMTPGATLQFSATTVAANGQVLTNRPITWSLASTQNATISATGILTALTIGTVEVRATSEGRTATATITITSTPAVFVSSMSVTPPSGTLSVGQSLSLNATARDAQGNTLTGRTITWASSANGVATVSSTGVVTAVSTGSATISATAEGVSGSASISVTAPTSSPVATMAITPSTAQMAIASTQQFSVTARSTQGTILTGRTVTWTSSNPAVASVSPTGLALALSVGTAVITATSEGVQASATITVTPKSVAVVTLTPPNPSLCVASSLQLVALPRDADGNVLTGRVVVWSVSNGLVASVSSTGVLLGLSLGTVTVTATVEGVSAQATLSLCAPLVATVTVSAPSTLLGLLGLPVQMGVVARDANGNVITGRTCHWSITPVSRALISIAGKVTPLLLGDVTVTATIDGVVGTKVLSILPGF